MEIVENITLDQVRAVKPERIFYSRGTCWWTHDPAHLCRVPGTSLPCDPRGVVLYEIDNPGRFLAAVEANPTHYGRHGLRAFMAAHHLNCVVSLTDPRPTCAVEWEEYNAALDRLDERRLLREVAELGERP